MAKNRNSKKKLKNNKTKCKKYTKVVNNTYNINILENAPEPKKSIKDKILDLLISILKRLLH